EMDMLDTRSRLIFAFSVSLCLCGSSSAAPTYWQDVRPVLRKHCTVCHSAKNLEKLDVSGGLALDSLEGIKKGGEIKVVTPGKASESRLIGILRHKDPSQRMPLDADPLPDETVALLRKWVDAGLPEGTRPREDDSAVAVQAPKRLRKLDVVLATN